MSGEEQNTVKLSTHKYVKLNVGGILFQTSTATLTKQDNMLKTMFSGRLESYTDSDGFVLIDRDGKHFSIILNFLRDGEIALPERKREQQELLQEAKFYLIKPLVDKLEKLLEPVTQPICSVALTVSDKELEELTSRSSKSKPVVKLACNRYNNKYSYTSLSWENLLKNIELFEKQSIRLHGRVLFIKDIISRNEICCWNFYGQGQHIAEVCCTSIVYGSERKHTKIDFPEARIFEELLNILVYEKREAWMDANLLKATQGVSVTPSEEEDVPEPSTRDTKHRDGR